MHEAKCTPKRVLLVDDDQPLCELLQTMVQRYFCAEVVVAYTVSQAKQIIAQDGAQFDGFILDARVTNGSGVTMYEHIMQRWPSARVVFLTGYDNPQFRDQVESVGPAPVFQKTSVMREDFLERLLSQIGIARKRPC